MGKILTSGIYPAAIGIDIGLTGERGSARSRQVSRGRASGYPSENVENLAGAGSFPAVEGAVKTLRIETPLNIFRLAGNAGARGFARQNLTRRAGMSSLKGQVPEGPLEGRSEGRRQSMENSTRPTMVLAGPEFARSTARYVLTFPDDMDFGGVT